MFLRRYVNKAHGYIDDYFLFTCGLGPSDLGPSYLSPQRENVTDGSTGERHHNAAYDMYVRDSKFKFITHYEWNSQVIGFKDDGQEQYAWVIEFQCGTRPHLPTELCLGHTVNGTCSFTGIQLFVRDLENEEQGRHEMLQYIHGLGPETSRSLGVAWVMDDFGPGTFPPWFKNTTYSKNCPFACKSGVFNETSGMWGCPPLSPSGNVKQAVPSGMQLIQ